MALYTINNGESGSSVRTKINAAISAVNASSGPNVIYVTTAGNDTTGDGSLGAPYLTAQKAFDVALAGSGDHLIKLGIGTFSVNPGAAWPLRIMVSGAGAYSTTLNITTNFDGALRGQADLYLNLTATGEAQTGPGGYGNTGPTWKLRRLLGGTIQSNGSNGATGAQGSPGDEASMGGVGGAGGTGGTGGAISCSFCDFQAVNSLAGSGGAGGPGGADGGLGAGGEGSAGSAGTLGVVSLMSSYVESVECSTINYGHSIVGTLTGAVGSDDGNNTTMADPTD